MEHWFYSWDGKTFKAAYQEDTFFNIKGHKLRSHPRSVYCHTYVTYQSFVINFCKIYIYIAFTTTGLQKIYI